jgi:hypothetical protein
MKKTFRVVMILVMLLGLTLSILNVTSLQNQAMLGGGVDGTTNVGDDGVVCQGPPLNCPPDP